MVFKNGPRISKLNRFLLSKAFLLIMNIATLLIVIVITYHLGSHFVEHFNHGAHERGEALSETVALLMEQETIGILLVSIGVVLEGREVFARHVFRVNDFDNMPEQDELNLACEYYGFYILVVGLLMETANQLSAVFEHQHNLVIAIQGLFNLPLNLLAIGLLFVVTRRIWLAPTRKL